MGQMQLFLFVSLSISRGALRFVPIKTSKTVVALVFVIVDACKYGILTVVGWKSLRCHM